jgi:hypothetical protein
MGLRAIVLATSRFYVLKIKNFRIDSSKEINMLRTSFFATLFTVVLLITGATAQAQIKVDAQAASTNVLTGPEAPAQNATTNASAASSTNSASANASANSNGSGVVKRTYSDCSKSRGSSRRSSSASSRSFAVSKDYTQIINDGFASTGKKLDQIEGTMDDGFESTNNNLVQIDDDVVEGFDAVTKNQVVGNNHLGSIDNKLSTMRATSNASLGVQVESLKTQKSILKQEKIQTVEGGISAFTDLWGWAKSLKGGSKKVVRNRNNNGNHGGHGGNNGGRTTGRRAGGCTLRAGFCT